MRLGSGALLVGKEAKHEICSRPSRQASSIGLETLLELKFRSSKGQGIAKKQNKGRPKRENLQSFRYPRGGLGA